MRKILFACSALFSLTAAAQTLPPGLVHAGYNWDASRRQRLPVTAAEAELPAVIVKDFTSLEYYHDESRPDQGLRVFATEHRIVRVNTSDGIERYNKIVVPVLETGGTVDVKARTISPRGEVREVRAADMKELKNEDGQSGYRILAVDGVEKGSEVEYFYTREKPFSHIGKETLQGETPAHDVTFELISPDALTFEAKVYHGPALTKDSTLADHHVLRLTQKDVPALRDEPFANVAAQAQRVEYKLAYLASKGRIRQFTWADASQYMYRVMTDLSKDEAKAVAKVLSAAKVPAGAPLPERIAAIENYVKTTFNPAEGASSNLAQVLATHNAPDIAFSHLLAALYRKMGIEYELVVTTDRTTTPFDGTFDTWNYLDHFVLYFPATQQYLAPSRPELRYGMVPADWTDNDGLFIRTVKLGSIESAVGSIKHIPALTAEQSPQDIDATVTFAPDLSSSTVQLRQTLGGYSATVIQPFWTLIPEAKRTEILQDFQKGIVPDASNFQQLEARNVERSLNPLTAPFIVEGRLQSTALVDKAGPRYLFKIGTLLGPQTELYQKEERQFDVENTQNRSYHRVIRFEVPAGYTVRNLQELNVDVKTRPATGQTIPAYDFRSGYTQQGQLVTVTITENYRQISWPKAEFEPFRDVVNAAANFNKVVLVLEKKN